MQELLLLTLMSVLSPVSTQCTDQGEGEEVVEAEDQSSEGESDQEETGDEGSQAEQGGDSASEKKEDKKDGDKKDEIQAPNDFDFSGDEFNDNKEETGTGSIFDASTFEATEGVKVEAAAVPAA